MKKTLILFFLASCFASFLGAKVLTLPANCHYMYTKSTDLYSKNDLMCFIKFLAVDLNKDTPYEVSDNLELLETVPNGKNLIIKYNFLGSTKMANVIARDWEADIIDIFCEQQSIRYFLNYDLTFSIRYYKNGKQITKGFISKKNCND